MQKKKQWNKIKLIYTVCINIILYLQVFKITVVVGGGGGGTVLFLKFFINCFQFKYTFQQQQQKKLFL